MKVTLTNQDVDLPVIVRTIRVDMEGEEIDAKSESQLLPDQTSDFDIGDNEALLVFKR